MKLKRVFDICRKKRTGGLKGYYFVWILEESGVDSAGYYQYSKVIADFGNIKKKENYQNAKKLKQLLESEAQSA